MKEIMKQNAEKKVIFLDRDGTINEEVNYLHRREDMKLLAGAAKAIGALNQAGYYVVVVTNQAGVARGIYTENDVNMLHEYMNELLLKQGAHIDSFYYCPHHPEHGIGVYKKNCRCRKPEIGMFKQAESDLHMGVNKSASYMIGDKLLDTEAGHRFGVKSILVGTGYGMKIRSDQEKVGTATAGGGCLDGSYDYFAVDLVSAVEWILETELKHSVKGEEQS